MKKIQREAILAYLADGLIKNGSWCGETHLQKATYFLQELMEVPTEFEFILYKHGPFSFDLRDELTTMRANGLLELVVRHPQYGSSLIPTQFSQEFRNQFPKTLARYREQIDFVSTELGEKNVSELERLGTALFITLEEGPTSQESRARRLIEIKPHIGFDEAYAAVRQLDSIVERSRGVAA
jgi:uncharacterized protein YwgA